MLKRAAIAIAMTLGLTACTIQPFYQEAPQAPPAKEVKVTVTKQEKEFRPPIAEVTQPPSVLNYKGISDDVVVLKSYATDLNWYMFYLFSYTHVINKFAMSRGWEPPKTEPLCKTFKWPKQMEVPIFEYREGMSLADLEVELTIYIEESQARYEGQVELFKEAEMWQRRLCMY